jgi:hypothetical protein
MMPKMETRPIAITLTVEVDGHTLTFRQSGEANGSFYHGRKPAYDSIAVMEKQIQGVADSLIAKVGREASDS